MRPTWAEISLAALRHNFRAVQDHVGREVVVCCVVKADAYGHGAVECARSLAAEGATWFGVSSTEEGMRLREGGITGRILLMSGFWPGEERAIVEHALTPAIWEPGQAQLLEETWNKVPAAAQKHANQASAAPSSGYASAKASAGRGSLNASDSASNARNSLAVHLKIDTGMTRLGADPQNLSSLCKALKKRQAIELEGAFTHLASSEIADSPELEAQLSRFDAAIETLRANQVQPRHLHVANSAALLSRPASWKNMVRPGLALYGYCLPLVHRSGTSSPLKRLPLQPALSWKTRILALREVAAGCAISYGAAYVTPRPARIAVLPVGYADGLSRRLSGRNTVPPPQSPAPVEQQAGRVMVRGQYAPIVGNVTMDLTMIDVTAISSAAVGDEVTLIGAAGNCAISAEEQATLAGTIPYEILCGISRRVARRYV